MDLILIRHPAVGVPTGICYGRSDVPLAADPSAEVQRCLNRIGTLNLCDPVGAVHASVLSRCTQIAAPLAAHFNVAMQADPRLQEIDFGRWEMQAWDAIDRAEIDAWAQDLENVRTHGGESVAMLALRVGAWLEECERTLGWAALAVNGKDATPLANMRDASEVSEVSEISEKNSAGRPVVAIAHAGVIRVLTALALRLPLATCVDWHLAFGGLCQLRYSVSQKRWMLVTWNGV
jgi:alpha-ribazole phosphatase